MVPHLLNMARRLTAALFDGHGTGAAADRLNDSLYDEFSHAIDDQNMNTIDDLEPCEIKGASHGASLPVAQAHGLIHGCMLVLSGSP